MMQELPPQVDQLIRSLGEVSRQILADFKGHDTRPATLFHFTDAAGVLGIVKDKSLWASWAMGLSDASEVVNGIYLAKECLTERLRVLELSDNRRALLERARNFLDPQNVPAPVRITLDHFVISFCPSASESIHWQLYGRGGDGYALEFETAKLVVPPFFLVRVIYDKTEKRKLVELAIRKVEETFLKYLPNLRSDERNAGNEAAALLFANTIRALAAHFKKQVFASDDE